MYKRDKAALVESGGGKDQAVGAIAVGVAAGPAASGATAAAVLGVTTAASRCAAPLFALQVTPSL